MLLLSITQAQPAAKASLADGTASDNLMRPRLDSIKSLTALRGAEGGHRAKRGSLRSKRRAALAGLRELESSGGAPGRVQRGLEGAQPLTAPSAARYAGRQNNSRKNVYAPAGRQPDCKERAFIKITSNVRSSKQLTFFNVKMLYIWMRVTSARLPSASPSSRLMASSSSAR